MSSKRHVVLPMIALLSLISSGLAGCGSHPADTLEHDPAMAPLGAMPIDIQQAPASVRQAYQFAVANPDVMQQIPCYCGCGTIGHTSNYACYVQGQDAAGNVVYDRHALGCSICVDITQDTLRLLRQGKSVPEIRTYVDAAYTKYGSSNMP